MVADLAGNEQRFLEECRGLSVILAATGDDAKIGQGAGDCRPVPTLACDREALLGEGGRTAVVGGGGRKAGG